MRKFGVMLMLLCAVSTGHAVVIGDFETGLDGWNAGWDGTAALSTSTAAGTVTSGSQSLAVTAVGGYWQLQAAVPMSVFEGVTNLSSISFDLTQLASEWPADQWTQVGDQIIVQSDGPSGQVALTSAITVVNRADGTPAGKDWGNWGGSFPDNAKTYTLNLGNYDLTGATYFQINISIQGGNGVSNFYFDNAQAEVLIPVSTWQRYEVEEAVLSGAYNVGSGEGSDPAWSGFSGTGYVRLQNPANNQGVIAMKVNVREAGDYPARYAIIAPGDEHWDNWAVNVDLSTLNPGSAAGYLCRENYAAAYTMIVNAETPPGDFSQEELNAFVAAIELGAYGNGPEPWQIISLWGPHWNENVINRNDPMLIPLNAGMNTLYIQAGWGWATYDYVELEVGYVPTNPSPADTGYAIISQDTTLSWDNALFDLDSIEVWFGETPEPNELDPNAVVNVNNYKEKLTLIHTESNPGPSTTIAIPALMDGVNYTWVVDGIVGDPENPDPNDAFYGGPFWSFFATNNVPPTVDAGPDQYKWLVPPDPDVVVTLDGTGTTDDGLDEPLTYSWTQIAGPDATIDTPDAATTSATLTGGLGNTTEAGAGAPYQFQLEVFDGLWTRTDTVTIHVNSNSCTASIEAGGFYYFGDIAGPGGSGDEFRDCKVDLYDFAELALNWLGCSNTFEACP